MHEHRFSGYQNTPLLWKGNIRKDIPKPFRLPNLEDTITGFSEDVKLRLGNLVERFFFKELSEITSIKILANNIQIKSTKITIGELDCIIDNNGHFEHIEVVYKFYLYNEIDSTNELVNWIGPNKKDSLIEKLNKLASKQFPLLHKPETKVCFQNTSLPNPAEIEQFTYFKAQLFTPFQKEVQFELLNKKCIEGMYVNMEQLKDFEENQFFIPEKLDWLCKPKKEAAYVQFDLFCDEVQKWLIHEKSPLCWMKSTDGALSKLFIVWW